MKELMKKTIVIFLLFSSVYLPALAAGEPEGTNISDANIDIRGLVKKQIHESEQKNLNRRLKSSLQNVIDIENEELVDEKYTKERKSDSIKGNELGLLIFISAAISVLLILLVRRLDYRKAGFKDEKISLKKGIAMIRNEEPIFKENEDLLNVRKNLIKELVYVSDSSAYSELSVMKNNKLLIPYNRRNQTACKFNIDFAAKARALNISIGELLLASKINSYN